MRFRPGHRQVRPITLSPEELYTAVGTLVRGADGQRCRLNAASLTLYPVVGPSVTLEVPLVIAGVCSEDYQRVNRLKGERVFFTATLGEAGLSQVRQLPVRFVQEAGRKRVGLVEKGGIVHLPEVAMLLDFKPFAIGEEDLALYLRFAVGEPPVEPREEGAQAQAGQTKPAAMELLTPLVVSSGGHHPRFARLDVLDVPAKVSGSAIRAYALPVLLGQWQGGDLILAANCDSAKDGKPLEQACAAVVSIGP